MILYAKSSQENRLSFPRVGGGRLGTSLSSSKRAVWNCACARVFLKLLLSQLRNRVEEGGSEHISFSGNTGGGYGTPLFLVIDKWLHANIFAF